VVEPGAKPRRDAEFVHQRADDDGVDLAQLADQRVRKRPDGVLGRRDGLASAPPSMASIR
jgi:hypothetical protein